jgi:cytochrome b
VNTGVREAAGMAGGRNENRLRVWDAPVRMFHWTLVALIAFAWWTAEERMLDWHRLAGYAILTLVLFRLIWGVVGSSTARFGSFLRGPKAVASYIRRDMFRRNASPHAGHNPLGGWSVLVMLLLLAAQTLLGLFAIDIDGLESGPFSYLADFDTGRQAAELHHWVFNLLLAVIALHVIAIAYFLLHRRDNLLGPMLWGFRTWRGEKPILRFAPFPLAIAILTGLGVLIWATVHFLGQT